jgi:polar amino acid transport system substrate-binding protein
VFDNGTGIDKGMQLRIFEPFFTTKEPGKGTGLGLSMAYGIVKKHDGFINVYSEHGSGTIIKIYLPRVGDTAPIVKMTTREMATQLGGSETILVGEDDAALRRLATKVLSHYGYRVIEAVDGQDAIDRFKEFKDAIHLVILDLVMPKKNGKVACDEMKVLRPDLKTVFTSGYARDIIGSDDIFDENTSFINKPISPNDMVAKVREMLDKKPTARVLPETLRYENAGD